MFHNECMGNWIESCSAANRQVKCPICKRTHEDMVAAEEAVFGIPAPSPSAIAAATAAAAINGAINLEEDGGDETPDVDDYVDGDADVGGDEFEIDDDVDGGVDEYVLGPEAKAKAGPKAKAEPKPKAKATAKAAATATAAAPSAAAAAAAPEPSEPEDENDEPLAKRTKRRQAIPKAKPKAGPTAPPGSMPDSSTDVVVPSAAQPGSMPGSSTDMVLPTPEQPPSLAAFDEVLCGQCGRFNTFSHCRLIAKQKMMWRCRGCDTKCTTLRRALGSWPPPEMANIPTDSQL